MQHMESMIYITQLVFVAHIDSSTGISHYSLSQRKLFKVQECHFTPFHWSSNKHCFEFQSSHAPSLAVPNPACFMIVQSTEGLRLRKRDSHTKTMFMRSVLNIDNFANVAVRSGEGFSHGDHTIDLDSYNLRWKRNTRRE